MQSTRSSRLIRRRSTNSRRAGILIWPALICLASIVPAAAAPCPRQGTLGTSRTLAVSVATTPRVGLKSFPDTLPLADHEVVLTFDDGPWPGTTSRVLATL